jgi:hypothetical protein
MKKKNKYLTYWHIFLFLAEIAVMMVGCNNKEEIVEDTPIEEESPIEEELPESSPSLLAGTKWKLTGYMDTETGELIEAEPKNCDDCFTIKFYSGTEGSVTVVLIYYHVNLSIEYIFKDPAFSIALGPDDSGIGNCRLFNRAIETVTSYELETDELKFFYNDKKNYLLCKLIESSSLRIIKQTPSAAMHNGRAADTKNKIGIAKMQTVAVHSAPIAPQTDANSGKMEKTMREIKKISRETETISREINNLSSRFLGLADVMQQFTYYKLLI